MRTVLIVEGGRGGSELESVFAFASLGDVGSSRQVEDGWRTAERRRI